MSAPRIHRVAGGTKAARQLMARHARPMEGPGLTPEQKEWNARIDAERAAKEAKKVAEAMAKINKAYDEKK